MISGNSTDLAYPGNIMAAAHRPTQLMIINIALNFLRMAAWYLTIVVFRVQDLGTGGIIYVIRLTEFPVNVLGLAVALIYINKTIFKLKFMHWQSFAVPAISTTILYFTFRLLKKLILDPLLAWNFYVMMAVALVLMILLVMGLYFPLTALLGGWDDNSIRDMRKAVKMSGLSRLLVVPMTKLVFWIAPKSKLHNRYKIDETDALREIEELIETRNKNRKAFQKQQTNKQINE